jgi:hypothetical protein
MKIGVLLSTALLPDMLEVKKNLFGHRLHLGCNVPAV